MAAAALLLLAGCQKDDLRPGRGERLTLNLEAFGGSGSKTVLADDDRSLQWLSGDQVRINGIDYAVSVAGGDAYVADVPEAASYKAVFPASMAEGKSMTGSTVTVALPRHYEYRTEGGLQVLDAPLAAVGDGNGGLTFRHLTGALSVVIQNTTSNTLYIDSVCIGSAQQLCGELTVDFDNLTAISPNTSPANAADTMVVLTVPYNTLSVAAGASVKVQLPVLPVSDANRFSIHVGTRYQGTRYDFDRRQGATANALARNEMGYVPATIATSGSHISVLPLFEYDAAQFAEYNEMIYYIKSPLDFMLLSDATNNDWEGPIGGAYCSSRAVRFNGTIDMSGYTIRQLQLSGQDGMLDFSGSNCQINNLTIDGSCLLGYAYVETWFFVNNLTFNNLTIEVPQGESYASAIINYFDSHDCGVSNVVVNGLTFNVQNSSANRTLSLAGIMGECDKFLFTGPGAGQWDFGFYNCSVTDIEVNITGTPVKDIYFGGLTTYVFNQVQDVDEVFPVTLKGTYIQNKPLNLTASGKIYYGGLATDMFDMGVDNNIDLDYSGEIVHNVSLNAPVVVAGGIMGYFDNDCMEGDVTYNVGGVVTQSGTIDITATTHRIGKKIATAVAPCGAVDFTDPDLVEYGITYTNGTFNDDALTITVR